MSQDQKPIVTSMEEFLSQMGLKVSDLDLIQQSLTHRSYAFEHDAMPDNERLEFLGDAVLGCIAAQFLCRHFPEDSEGDLSKKKGFLVSRVELGYRAIDLGLDRLVLLGRGEESSGGRNRLSITGSTLEALIGALVEQLSFEKLTEFVEQKILRPGLQALENEEHLDFKSLLQELVQKHQQTLPEYKRVLESGPAHEKSFIIEVFVAGNKVGRGEGSRVKTAENAAARLAYAVLLNQWKS